MVVVSLSVAVGGRDCLAQYLHANISKLYLCANGDFCILNAITLTAGNAHVFLFKIKAPPDGNGYMAVCDQSAMDPDSNNNIKMTTNNKQTTITTNNDKQR